MTIYVDLDNTLFDFKGAVFRDCGFDYNSDPKLAWYTLEKIPHWFMTIEPFPWAKDLLETIARMAPGHDIEILTALPQPTGLLYTAAEDKVWSVDVWLHAPELTVNTVHNWKDKERFYHNSTDILIDDSLRNINFWPGVGILHDPAKPNNTAIKLFKILNSIS